MGFSLGAKCHKWHNGKNYNMAMIGNREVFENESIAAGYNLNRVFNVDHRLVCIGFHLMIQSNDKYCEVIEV